MSAADPGFAALSGAAALDPRKGSVVDVGVAAGSSDADAAAGEVTPIVAPDQFDPRYETSRKEIWAWYGYVTSCARPVPRAHVWYASRLFFWADCRGARRYYVGNNGLTLFNFGVRPLPAPPTRARLHVLDGPGQRQA